MTEYGLTPINSDPKFAVGLVTYPAPEELNSPGQGNGMPLMESKAADVFAFAMFAVEVFTGKIPFHEQKNEAVVLQISRGGRPVMPANAQTVGLTGEMWKVLESCWQRDPKTRPTMEDVVRRWETFVEHEDNNDIITKCVQTIRVVRVFFSQLPWSIQETSAHGRTRWSTWGENRGLSIPSSDEDRGRSIPNDVRGRSIPDGI